MNGFRLRWMLYSKPRCLSTLWHPAILVIKSFIPASAAHGKPSSLASCLPEQHSQTGLLGSIMTYRGPKVRSALNIVTLKDLCVVPVMLNHRVMVWLTTWVTKLYARVCDNQQCMSPGPASSSCCRWSSVRTACSTDVASGTVMFKMLGALE